MVLCIQMRRNAMATSGTNMDWHRPQANGGILNYLSGTGFILSKQASKARRKQGIIPNSTCANNPDAASRVLERRFWFIASLPAHGTSSQPVSRVVFGGVEYYLSNAGRFVIGRGWLGRGLA